MASALLLLPSAAVSGGIPSAGAPELPPGPSATAGYQHVWGSGPIFISPYAPPGPYATEIKCMNGASMLGVRYAVQVSGTFVYRDDPKHADALYLSQDVGTFGNPVTWPWDPNHPAGLGLFINGMKPRLQAYAPDHVYYFTFIGTGLPICFQIIDSYPADNSGYLKADLFLVV